MFQKCKWEKGTSSQFLINYIWVHTSFWFFLFHQHVRHKTILKIKRYLSAYNEYYEICVEGAYINMKLRIGNWESGTGNWFLVPYLSKRLEYFKIYFFGREQGIGNRELVSCSLFWYVIPIFLKCKSGIWNQFPFPF